MPHAIIIKTLQDLSEFAFLNGLIATHEEIETLCERVKAATDGTLQNAPAAVVANDLKCWT